VNTSTLSLLYTLNYHYLIVFTDKPCFECTEQNRSCCSSQKTTNQQNPKVCIVLKQSFIISLMWLIVHIDGRTVNVLASCAGSAVQNLCQPNLTQHCKRIATLQQAVLSGATLQRWTLLLHASAWYS